MKLSGIISAKFLAATSINLFIFATATANQAYGSPRGADGYPAYELLLTEKQYPVPLDGPLAWDRITTKSSAEKSINQQPPQDSNCMALFNRYLDVIAHSKGVQADTTQRDVNGAVTAEYGEQLFTMPVSQAKAGVSSWRNYLTGCKQLNQQTNTILANPTNLPTVFAVTDKINTPDIVVYEGLASTANGYLIDVKTMHAHSVHRAEDQQQFYQLFERAVTKVSSAH